MLQMHFLEIMKQNLANQSEVEELEQYGRRQCLRFEGVPTEQNENNKHCVKSVHIWSYSGLDWSEFSRIRTECWKMRTRITPNTGTFYAVKVLSKVVDMCKEAGVDIPDTVIDRAFQIGEAYVNNKRKKNCKSIIVRFTTFCHRTMVSRAKKNMKNNVRVKLELTKKRFNLLVSANKLVTNISSVKFCYADMSYRPKIKWSDDSMNDEFFHSLN